MTTPNNNTVQTTLPATSPTTQASINLDTIFETHGYQKEVMADELYRVRKQNADDYTKEQAEKEVFDYLEQDQATMDAAARLESQRKSPMVSRETQMATLKGMIRDYEKGIRRPGLSAHSVLKAAELLNKMTGYEAPVEHKHEVEHTINVLPVIGESFKGALEPLDIIDLGEVSVANTSPNSNSSPSPQAQPPEIQSLPKSEGNIPKTVDAKRPGESSPQAQSDEPEPDNTGGLSPEWEAIRLDTQ